MTGVRDITQLCCSPQLARIVANKIEQSFYFVYSYSRIESIERILRRKSLSSKSGYSDFCPCCLKQRMGSTSSLLSSWIQCRTLAASSLAFCMQLLYCCLIFLYLPGLSNDPLLAAQTYYRE